MNAHRHAHVNDLYIQMCPYTYIYTHVSLPLSLSVSPTTDWGQLDAEADFELHAPVVAPFACCLKPALQPAQMNEATYIYIQTHTNACLSMYLCIYICVSIHTCVYMYRIQMYVCINKLICMYIHM